MSSRLVFLHGLASTAQEFALIRHPLARSGLELICPEIPGYSHGGPDGASRPAWQDWAEQAAAQLDQLLASNPEPVIIGGLCTGALLATLLARARPRAVRGLVMLSPSLACDGWALPWWYRLRHLAYALGLSRHFRMAERPPYGVKDERMRRWIRTQLEREALSSAGPASVSLRVVRESERLGRVVRRHLPKLAVPTLAVHARDDEICSATGMQAALATAPAHLTRTVLLHNSYHMITLDHDRAQLVGLIRDFVDHLPAMHHEPAGAVQDYPIRDGRITDISADPSAAT